MSRFIETLRVENGRISLLSYHKGRVERTQSHFGFQAGIDWEKWEENALMWPKNQGIAKLRIVYGVEGYKGEFLPYAPLQIEKLHLVEASSWEYSYKYEDRTFLENTKKGFADNEEVLLCKAGLIAESSFANIVFWNGEKWITPLDVFLEGTRRQFLLDQGKVEARRIQANELRTFSHWQLINALRDLDEFPSQPIAGILQ
jgi:4-amino-4-deoxychorismate lyase